MEDLSNIINQIFIKNQVEKVTMPGYAFIELSWAADSAEAPVKMFDICIAQSAMIFVNSRPICLREHGSWTARLKVSRQIRQWLGHTQPVHLLQAPGHARFWLWQSGPVADVAMPRWLG